MKTLLAKEARALVVPTVAAIFVYVALAVVITLYSSRGSYTPTLIVGTLLMPLIALLLGSWAFSNGGRQPVVEWESAWPVSRAGVWTVKVVAHVVALALIQTVCSVVPVLVMYGQQRMIPVRMVLRVLPAPWKYIGSPQFCFVLMVLAVALMFAGAMRKSATALGLSTLVVGVLTFLYLITIGDWIPQLFGPKLGIAQGYMGSRAVVGCALLMATILLWSSLRGIKATPPLAYQRRLAMTVRHAGLLSLVALPLFAGLVVWSVSPRQDDLKTVVGPTVSLDGRWVAFLGGRYAMSPAPGAGVWIVSADGSGLKCVGRGPVQSVRWLPDSRRLLVTWFGTPLLPMMRRTSMNSGAPRTSTWVIDCASGAIDRVPGLTDGITAMISPGGRWVLSGDKVQQLTPPYSALPVELAKDTPILGWSADDTMLLVGDPAFGPNDTITGLDVRSGARTVLAHAPVLPRPALPPEISGDLRDIQMAIPELHPFPTPEQHSWWVWSNRIIRRSAGGYSESSSGTSPTILVDRATGRSVSLPGSTLTNGFSPDGRYCWFNKNDESGVVSVMDLTTGQITATLPNEQIGRFSMGMGDPGNLQWSPDGQRLVCGQDTFDMGPNATSSGQKYRVWSVHADGTGLKVLYSVAEDWRRGLPTTRVIGCGVAGWTADGKVIVDDGGRALVRIDPDTAEKTDLLRLKAPETPASLGNLVGGAQIR